MVHVLFRSCTTVVSFLFAHVCSRNYVQISFYLLYQIMGFILKHRISNIIYLKKNGLMYLFSPALLLGQINWRPSMFTSILSVVKTTFQNSWSWFWTNCMSLKVRSQQTFFCLFVKGHILHILIFPNRSVSYSYFLS